MAARTTRLFTALWPDDALRERLVALRDAQWRLPARARPTRDDQLHVTLHFIGGIEADRVDALRAALDAVPAIEPIELVLDAAEVWRNGIASLVAREVPAALTRLHADIGAALDGIGIAVERRAWRPHLTLARDAIGAVPPVAPFALHWRVSGFVLVRSAPPGRYTLLDA